MALKKLFVEQYGLSDEFLRTLIVKYPFILSKEVDHIQSIIATFEEHGISREDTIKLIFDCPRLVSIKLEDKMAEMFELFELYHGFKKEEVVNDIFRNFPYLFCCSGTKVKSFLGHFRKY